MSERIEIIKTYQGPDVSVSQCLVTLEGFIGDTNEQELDDGTVLDASDAVAAINGLIWSMEGCEAENERLRACQDSYEAMWKEVARARLERDKCTAMIDAARDLIIALDRDMGDGNETKVSRHTLDAFNKLKTGLDFGRRSRP